MISFIPEEVGRCRELAFVEPAVINVFTGTHGTEAGGGGRGLFHQTSINITTENCTDITKTFH